MIIYFTYGVIGVGVLMAVVILIIEIRSAIRMKKFPWQKDRGIKYE